MLYIHNLYIILPVEQHKDFIYLNTFVWDIKKNEINKRKHNISFELAIRVFNAPLLLTTVDLNHSSQYETRWNNLGLLNGTVILFVVHTEQNGLTRIISARKATKKEVEDYETNAKRIQNY